MRLFQGIIFCTVWKNNNETEHVTTLIRVINMPINFVQNAIYCHNK